MPPSPTKHFYVPPNLKKKPPATSIASPTTSSNQGEKASMEIDHREHISSERLELGDGDQKLEAYADNHQEVEDNEEDHDAAKEQRKTDDYKVYVCRLDPDVTEKDLREAFSPVGDVIGLNLIKYANKTPFAFILFATIEQAQRAIGEFPNLLINGKQCRVGMCYEQNTVSAGQASSRSESREKADAKRSHSALEEGDPRYAESSTKQSRTCYDHQGSSSRVPSTVDGSSTEHSRVMPDTRTSTDDMRGGDEERMRSGDRVPSRADRDAASRSRDYLSRGKDDSNPSEGGSGSHQ